MDKSVLIVDDDRSQRRLISGVIRKSVNLQTAEAENGRDALRILDKDEDNDTCLVVLDIDMPVMDGFETLDAIRQNYPDLPVIVLTGSDNADVAVQAMKKGANDFLTKPVENTRLDVSARNTLKMSLMNREISRLQRRSAGGVRFSDLIGFESGLSANVKTGHKAAACVLPVLIAGETGTGKEMFARAIHGESVRSTQPFVAVNCGAIPEKLVESTLFGHEKGAFTGAINKAPGKFQEADGGTIFLDEIGELPLDAQVTLLRVLQQQEVEPVGAAKPVRINVRVISATNRDLAKEVREGRFREDLFFRLNVININLPPLRDRKHDIPMLADYFIEQFCAAHQSMPKKFSKEAAEKLQSYNWPGNVRELENIINRTMALSDNEMLESADFSYIETQDKQSKMPREGIIVPVDAKGRFKSLKELELEIMQMALEHHKGNMTETARVLGIAKSTLYSKIESLADKKTA